MRAGDRFACTRLLCRAIARQKLVIGRLPLRDHQISEEHVVNERGFSRTRHPGYAREHTHREIDVNVLQVVLPRAADFDPVQRRIMTPRCDLTAGLWVPHVKNPTERRELPACAGRFRAAH